ncbi:MAG TPA: sulfotransferase domain-containing protein [Rhizomicrobium sp.]
MNSFAGGAEKGKRMLFNDRLLFLHVPKTGGTSVTSYLIRNLRGGVTITEPRDRLPAPDRVSTLARMKFGVRRLRRQLALLRRPKVRRLAGTRHETLTEASETLARLGRRLEDFETIVAVIRNPYDLEVSRFHFFRRGHLGVAGLAQEYAEELALAGDFAAFARKAAYHGRLPGRIEDWFEIDGRMPANLRIIRFEKLETDLHCALASLCTAAPLPRLNASAHAPYKEYIAPAIEEAIYRKYRWLFDRGFYPRERT